MTDFQLSSPSPHPPMPIRSTATATALLLVLCATACVTSAPRDEVVVPPIEVEVLRYAGSSLTGPLSAASATIDVDPAHALALRCRISYLEHAPVGALELLASHARLVVAARSAEPFEPSTEFAQRVRMGVGDAARVFVERCNQGELGRTALVTLLEDALPRGVTVAFAARPPDRAAAVAERLAIELHRSATPVERDLDVAFVVDGARAGEVAARRESLALDEAPAPGGAPLVFVVPARFAGDDTGAFVVELSVADAPLDPLDRERHAASVVRLSADIADTERAARMRAEHLSSGESFIREVTSAFQALDDVRSQRPALVFLADATGAPLAEDLALVASDAELAAYVKLLRGSAAANATANDAGPASDGRELGWRLERGAYRHLTARPADAVLAPELAGILLRHAGEAGRFAGTIEDLLRDSASVADLDLRLVRENRIFLEDSLPGARVRAFDWLAARGLAPAEFDPLASVAARRAALARAEELDAIEASVDAGSPR